MHQHSRHARRNNKLSWPRRRRNAAIAAAAVSFPLALAGVVFATPGAQAATETMFSTATPSAPVDTDAQSVELGMRFSVTTPGTITGVRYYGTAANTGTHTGSLWSSSGSRLATATFASSKGDGWKSVEFTKPVHVTTGSTYVASYLAPSGHYVDQEQGFSKGSTRDHLVTKTGAGVYAYGRNGGFPTQNWHNSNYYVDVTFVPDAATDGTPAPSTGTTSSSPSSSSKPTSAAPTSSAPSSSSAVPSKTPSTTASSSTASSSAPVTTPSAGDSTAAPATARDCATAPSACGYPDATTTGVTPGTTLKTYNSTVTVSTNGAVFENAIVNGALNITANNVTIRNVRVINNGDGWGIGLMHTNGTTIDHVQVMRGNGQRLESGIKDVYGDDTNTTITNADVSGTETGIFMHEGLLRDSYIHDLAMNTGDHVNGVSSNGETTPLSIDHNTILNPISQTDAIALFQDFGLEANRTITNNLIAGGGYSLYAGAGSHGTSHHIVITGNRFSRLYYAKGGSYGPATAYDTNGTGNAWTNNTWDDTGTTVTP